jgi:hypothetical protein
MKDKPRFLLCVCRGDCPEIPARRNRIHLRNIPTEEAMQKIKTFVEEVNSRA